MFQKLLSKLIQPNLQKNSAIYSVVTKQGHTVRSLAEKIIDDCLFDSEIEYYYEDYIIILNPTTDWQEFIHDQIYESKFGKLNKFRNYRFDWVIIGRDFNTHRVVKAIFIEYFGRKDKKYIANSKQKRDLYNKLGFPLIEIYPNDMKNIREILRIKLAKEWHSIQTQSQNLEENRPIELNLPIKRIINEGSSKFLENLLESIQKELANRTGSVLIHIPVSGKFKENTFFEDKSSSGKIFKSYRDPQVKIILYDSETDGGKFHHIYLKPHKITTTEGIKLHFSLVLYDQTIIGVRSKSKLQKEEKYSNSYEYYEVDLTQTSESSGHIKYLRKLYSAGQAYSISKERSNLFNNYRNDRTYNVFFK